MAKNNYRVILKEVCKGGRSHIVVGKYGNGKIKGLKMTQSVEKIYFLRFMSQPPNVDFQKLVTEVFSNEQHWKETKAKCKMKYTLEVGYCLIENPSKKINKWINENYPGVPIQTYDNRYMKSKNTDHIKENKSINHQQELEFNTDEHSGTV